VSIRDFLKNLDKLRSNYIGMKWIHKVLFHHLVVENHLWDRHPYLTSAEASNCTKSGKTEARSQCQVTSGHITPASTAVLQLTFASCNLCTDAARLDAQPGMTVVI